MKQFPIVKASGSHYEVGVAIGKTMRDAIRNVLANNQAIFKKDFPVLIQQSQPFQQQARKYFPQYMDELREISDGAGVSFDELFLSNNREVADFDPFIVDQSHCTIIGIPHKNDYLLGHNEDWDASSLSLLYLLDATINGVKIFGLNYANNIIGDSIAVNGYGLVQGVNDLWHQDSHLGVPKNFIARAILDCKTHEEAEDIMRTVPRAAGFNHVLVQEQRLWNIESSAKEYVIEKVQLQKYVHTNHYLTELKRIDKGNKESEARYAKVKDLLSGINTVNDIKRVLSDREGPQICRSGTIGSVIFDMPNKVAHIAYGQPTPESYVEYSLTHVLD
ncbi:hypothetical protein HY087_00560 [Candidatus Gottesmanbacteria bacterium]|nr:hypothetical protein [Candidatus Gottesmanbacteria bacterium]